MPLKKSAPTIASDWQQCLLTWYDPALGGTNSSTGAANPTAATASGEPYSASAMTCAAPPAYAFGTYITFAYGARRVTCKVNDRGGAITGTHFDLSRAAATALGMIVAGEVRGKFVVVSGAGNPAPSASPNTSNTSNSSSGGGGAGSGSLLDLLTGSVSTIGDTLALIALQLLKDIGTGIADYILIPTYHWQQRAVWYYETSILFDTAGHPKSLPATAVFWGLGYYLLWTDPDSGSLRPAPAQRTRMARHVRALQAIPARRAIIKPKNVKQQTPTKPAPTISRVELTPVGTMSTARQTPVKIGGSYHDRRAGSSAETTDNQGTPGRASS